MRREYDEKLEQFYSSYPDMRYTYAHIPEGNNEKKNVINKIRQFKYVFFIVIECYD